MLRSYIERREKSFHERDNNRSSLPFEWGLDHLEIDGNIRDVVSSALMDSDSFYSYQPTTEYEIAGGILKFPSAVRTPYPENNTVWGRYFAGDKDLAMVVLPQWNCKWDDHLTLSRVLQRLGIGSVRLSMPYHHHRKPAHLERSEYMISPNIGRTIVAARQAVLDARRTADWLFDQGYRRVGIIGTSIGSCIAFLTFAHDVRFSAGVFIHVSSFYADVVWTGLSTKHVRHSLETAIDLQQLRFLWSPISPYPFIKRLRGSDRRILMLSGRYDLTFLPSLSQQAYDEFDRCGIRYDLSWLPCGHYTMGQFPFNTIIAYRIVQFLTRQLAGPAKHSPA